MTCLITIVLLLVGPSASDDREPSLQIREKRPAATSDLAKFADVQSARREARSLLNAGRASDALRVLLPWRTECRTNPVLAEDFYECFALLGDWRLAYEVVEERMSDVARSSGKESSSSNNIIRAAAAYLFAGEVQQAWEFYQLHRSEIPDNTWRTLFAEQTDRILTSSEFPRAISLAAARMSAGSPHVATVFFEGALLQEPRDAQLNLLLGLHLRSLDARRALECLDIARSSGDETIAPRADREYRRLEWKLNQKEKGVAGFSIGGGR